MTNAVRIASLYTSALVAAVVAALWLLVVVPETAYFLLDADGGFFIQGAYDWRVAGLLPQVDVHSSYGPLSFAVRAALQSLFGDRLVTEVLLAVIGYGIAYGLLFSVVRDLTRSPGAAWALVLAALLCLPRYYKFPVVLIPALSTFVGVRLVTRPVTAWSAVGAGASVGLALLFRHDYFAFASAVVGLAFVLRMRRDWRVWRLLPVAVAGWALVSAPWLGVLARTRGLGSYAEEIMGVTGSKIVGLGLPHPLLHWTNPVVTLLFALVYAMPLMAIAALLATRRQPGEPASRHQLWVAVAAGLVFLPQSMHRADYGHLLQVVPSCLTALAAAWRLTPTTRAVPSPRLVAPLLVGAMVCALGYLGGSTVPSWSGQPLRGRLAALFVPADRIASRVGSLPPSVPRQVLTLLRSCAPRGTSVAVFPFAPQLAYFSGLVHGGAFLVLAPGYFDDPASLADAFAALGRDRTSIVLWDETMIFDGRSDRHSVRTHAPLHASVAREFREIGTMDGYTIFVHPELTRDVSFVLREARCL